MMDRYQKALQDLLVQSQSPEISDEQIRQFVRGKSDREIARVMMNTGINVNQFAKAINRPVSEVRERFDKVLPEATADNKNLRESKELREGRLRATAQQNTEQTAGTNMPSGIMNI